MLHSSIISTIGNTSVVKLDRLFGEKHQVYIKLERENPGGSIKDRIALSMIEDAEKSGKLTKNHYIVEPTSGNTGIGLALIGAVKGYKVKLTMPESMSLERRRILAAYGAELVLTPKELGMKGAIDKATEINAQDELAWMPSQFENPANIQAHLNHTAKEIVADFDGKPLDAYITGVGTGGHISGVSQVLKQHYPDLETLAVEPAQSPVIGGGEPGPHKIQGIGAGFIPNNFNSDVVDGSIQVDQDKAFEFAQKLAKTEGILAGISTGASLAAVHQYLEKQTESKTVLLFNYDTGERYFSVEGLY